MMQFNLPVMRLVSYAVLILFSFLVFCFSVARINHTNRSGFYESVVVELLVTTLLTIPYCLFLIFAIHKRFEHPYLGVFATEIAGLIVLWFFWIIGAAIASSDLGPSATCTQSVCSVVASLLAFSWLGWVTVTAILAVALLFTIANSAFREPLHGRWDPRQSVFGKA